MNCVLDYTAREDVIRNAIWNDQENAVSIGLKIEHLSEEYVAPLWIITSAHAKTRNRIIFIHLHLHIHKRSAADLFE